MKKWPILVFVLCLGLLGQGRGSNQQRSILRVTPHGVELKVEQNGVDRIHLSAPGEFNALTISADEMMFDEDSGEVQLSGHVRLKLDTNNGQ